MNGKVNGLILALLVFGLLSCEDLQDPPIDKKHTSLFVKLSVNPGNDVAGEKSYPAGNMDKLNNDTIEEINIDLLVVGVIINDTLHSLFTNAGVYNLLDYTEMKDTIIASKSVPVGYLSQIRLVLANNNSIKVNGEYYELKPPSANDSGLKLNVQEDIEYGVIYTYKLDLDLEKSIVQNDTKYLLKPVINVTTLTAVDTTNTGW